MLRSLRFRLPAFFLAGVVVAGLVATGIAVKLFQDYTSSRTYSALRRESLGLAKLYGEKAGFDVFKSSHLEEATGDRIFYVNNNHLTLFNGVNKPPIRQLPPSTVDWARLKSQGMLQLEFTPAHSGTTYVGVARPVTVGGKGFGALIVASPKSVLRTRWLTLIERLAIAFAGGILVAAALGYYLSRRITKPVLALAHAADEVAEGQYDVEIPHVPGGGEIRDLAERFGEMTLRLREAEQRERTFLMTVSHELRTPLTAIRGHIEALREGVAADEESRQESLSVVYAETERLDRLVGDVLDLAKLNARRFSVRHEEVDMSRVVEVAYTAFTEEARRRGIDYDENVDGRPVIVSDGDRVLQIISNLLSNAFRWTPDGGRIGVALEAKNGTVAVSVADTGPGIPTDEVDRIFRPFWSRDGRGTGLGLPIAHELAGALGGRIELETEPGHGSCFRLVLPNPSVGAN
jgi:signal transduction histidine kinase